MGRASGRAVSFPAAMAESGANHVIAPGLTLFHPENFVQVYFSIFLYLSNGPHPPFSVDPELGPRWAPFPKFRTFSSIDPIPQVTNVQQAESARRRARPESALVYQGGELSRGGGRRPRPCPANGRYLYAFDHRSLCRIAIGRSVGLLFFMRCPMKVGNAYCT